MAMPAILSGQEKDWVKLEPLGGGFSVSMPKTPREEVARQDQYILHLFSAQNDKAIYTAAYIDYAPSIQLNIMTELVSNRDSYLDGLKARLTSSRNITVEGRAGLEFTAESDKASFRSRIFIFGNRLYQIAAAVMDGNDDSENVKRFFDSFKFTTGKPPQRAS